MMINFTRFKLRWLRDHYKVFPVKTLVNQNGVQEAQHDQPQRSAQELKISKLVAANQPLFTPMNVLIPYSPMNLVHM